VHAALPFLCTLYQGYALVVMRQFCARRSNTARGSRFVSAGKYQSCSPLSIQADKRGTEPWGKVLHFPRRESGAVIADMTDLANWSQILQRTLRECGHLQLLEELHREATLCSRNIYREATLDINVRRACCGRLGGMDVLILQEITCKA
jgi:hypothetical protein